MYRPSLLLCAVLLFGARPLRAQTGSTQMSVLAVASVASTIKVRGTADLSFGTVVPGVARTVGVTGGPAGSQPGTFSVDGVKNAEVQIDFNLPTQLVTAGGRRLTIDSWTGCFNVLNSVPGCTAFVPGTPNTRLRSNNGKLWVWIGATVRPGPAQGTGAYSGTVQMTVLYTGN